MNHELMTESINSVELQLITSEVMEDLRECIANDDLEKAKKLMAEFDKKQAILTGAL